MYTRNATCQAAEEAALAKAKFAALFDSSAAGDASKQALEAEAALAEAEAAAIVASAKLVEVSNDVSHKDLVY